MTLEQLRKQWENTLTVIAEKAKESFVVVILRDKDTFYHLHRYFEIGIGEDRHWEVSVDLQSVDEEKIFKWLLEKDVFE